MVWHCRVCIATLSVLLVAITGIGIFAWNMTTPAATTLAGGGGAAAFVAAPLIGRRKIVREAAANDSRRREGVVSDAINTTNDESDGFSQEEAIGVVKAPTNKKEGVLAPNVAQQKAPFLQRLPTSFPMMRTVCGGSTSSTTRGEAVESNRAVPQVVRAKQPRFNITIGVAGCRLEITVAMQAAPCREHAAQQLAKAQLDWYSQWLLQKVGPDALRFIADGPERAWAPTAFDSATCTYRAALQVFTAGEYSLDMRWDLDGSWHLREDQPTITTFRNARLGSVQFKCDAKDLPTLQGCCTRRRVVGRYVVAAFEAKGADAYLPPPSALPYYPWKGSQYVFEGLGCRLAPLVLRPSAWASCLVRAKESIDGAREKSSVNDGVASGAKKTPAELHVFFTGDSQIRTLFRHFDSVVTRSAAIIAKGGNLTTRVPGVVSVRYLWDPYLDSFADRVRQFPAGPLAGIDVVVLGIGPWPASFGQWSMLRYSAEMDRIATVAKQLVGAGVVVVWAGAPAWPKPRKNVPGFRITNYRLGAMNTIGAKALFAVGAVHLDLFSLSYPLMHLHRGDGMHYDRSVVLYSAVNVLMNVLCWHDKDA